MIKNKYKLILFASVLIIGFSIFLFLTFKEYSYEKKYSINEYEIKESYNKEDGYYVFLIKSEDIVYPYLIKDNYTRKREVITNIEEYTKDEETCLLPISQHISFYPLCSKNNQLYMYNLSEIKNVNYEYLKIKNLNQEYKNIKINFLNNKSFLIYNYKGFYLINKNITKEIKLFNEDIYTFSLVFEQDNNLIIPDYNQKYYFNTFYIINMNSGKVKKFNFENDISFESEFLGEYKNNIYLIDKKEKKEYKININKEIVEEVPIQLLKNNKLVEVSYQTIVNNNYRFYSNNLYTYEVIDNKLYMKVNEFKIKLSNKNITKIITYENDTVYYLSDENLYMYNYVYGEILLLSNFEWNFNNTNVIYFSK